MLKMVIADDEYRVLQLIKKLVQWDELGIACVGEADNGAAALDLIVSQTPDIVITDIRMPGTVTRAAFQPHSGCCYGA